MGWTQKFPDEFRSRRGYDVWPALAAKAGAEMSGRDLMLRDFDETISELFAENHYAYQKEVANRHGLESEAEVRAGPACGCRLLTVSSCGFPSVVCLSPHLPFL